MTRKYSLNEFDLQTFLTLFLMTHPVVSVERLWSGWDKSRTLSDYQRPPLTTLEKVVEAIKKDLLTKGVGW